MADKAKEQALQEKYYEFQVINENIKQFQQQLQMLEEQVAELRAALEALISLEKTKDKETLLVPIGQGIFAKANFQATSSLLVNVGSNIMVSKDIPSAKKMLEEREQAVEIYKEQSSANIMELARQAKKLESELQALLQSRG
jgi:prefoldin alpha subunit